MLKLRSLNGNSVFANSLWGLIAHFSQAVLTSLFYVIVARTYTLKEFADYAIALSLYQLVASFSSLGLGQWFIREMAGNPGEAALVNRFLKIEICSGLLFYVVNSLAAFYTYNHYIGVLTMILGVNIIFDNGIYGIKNLNIAQYEQVKTFVIVAVEALLKLVAGCVLLIHPLSLVSLTMMLVAVRFATFSIFMKAGSASLVTFGSIACCRVKLADVRALVLKNWPFIVIGSASITYWRIASIIISKRLDAADVASYEICYKVFSLAQMLPVIISASIFPILTRLFANGAGDDLRAYYRRMYSYYFAFGVISYAFIYSFADKLVPLVFGSAYSGTPPYTREMFFTMLLFPTAYLQANTLVAMELERYDMWLNMVALACNIVISLVALSFVHSLSVINYAIFASFFIFHVLQNVILIRHRIAAVAEATCFYLLTLAIAVGYPALSSVLRDVNALVPFSLFAFCLLVWGVLDALRTRQASRPS